MSNPTRLQHRYFEKISSAIRKLPIKIISRDVESTNNLKKKTELYPLANITTWRIHQFSSSDIMNFLVYPNAS